jgi:hypothetical protein
MAMTESKINAKVDFRVAQTKKPVDTYFFHEAIGINDLYELPTFSSEDVLNTVARSAYPVEEYDIVFHLARPDDEKAIHYRRSRTNENGQAVIFRCSPKGTPLEEYQTATVNISLLRATSYHYRDEILP